MFDFEYIKDIVKKNLLAIFSVLFGVVCLIICGGVIYYYNYVKQDSKEEPLVLESEPEVDSPVSTTLKVDIKGAVKKAGVYELESGSNIQDAITLAGGITSKASTKNINLAKKLTDEMVIYIFTKDELKKQETSNEIVCEIPKCECETITVAECPTVDDTLTENDTTTDTSDISKKISINTASIEELSTLNGIGESKAQAIIEYRETNGPFKSIEDIKNVSGIGEAAFLKIKDNITV